MPDEDKINDEDLTWHAEEAGASSDSSTSSGNDDERPQGPPMRRARVTATSDVTVHADSVTSLPAHLRRSAKSGDGKVVVM